MLLDGDPVLLLLFNRGTGTQVFTLPGGPETVWRVVFDTGVEEAFSANTAAGISGEHELECHTVACLELVSGACQDWVLQ
jgi:hypothetical protein